jgi:hypothetical protein
MTAQDDEKHYEQEENHAKTGNGKWTAEAIRALGATTDLQTLADMDPHPVLPGETPVALLFTRLA